jgi:hypothetical protein
MGIQLWINILIIVGIGKVVTLVIKEIANKGADNSLELTIVVIILGFLLFDATGKERMEKVTSVANNVYRKES